MVLASWARRCYDAVTYNPVCPGKMGSTPAFESCTEFTHWNKKREKLVCVWGGGGGGEGVRLRHHRDQCGDTDPARLLVKSVYVLIYLL